MSHVSVRPAASEVKDLAHAQEHEPDDGYLINSPMLPDLKKDADGGLTIHIQHQPPMQRVSQ